MKTKENMGNHTNENDLHAFFANIHVQLVPLDFKIQCFSQEKGLNVKAKREKINHEIAIIFSTSFVLMNGALNRYIFLYLRIQWPTDEHAHCT